MMEWFALRESDNFHLQCAGAGNNIGDFGLDRKIPTLGNSGSFSISGDVTT
jgi:hypothetical protein